MKGNCAKSAYSNMKKTDTLIFILFVFALLIFSTVLYDRVQVFEARTSEIHTIMVDILKDHTTRLVAWGPPKKEEGEHHEKQR